MDTDTSRGVGIPPRLILGLTILAIGAFLVLQNLGILSYHVYWGDLWPLILIVIGISHILQPRRHRTGGFVLFFIGCWFLAHNAFDFDLDFRYFLPGLLLLVGAALVWGSLTRRPRAGVPDGAPGSSAVVHPLAVLGGARTASNSPAFEGGSATAVLGGCTIDLRGAAIAPGQEALIDAVACWGGILILVPESWEVVLRGTPILGSFQDSTQPPVGGSTQRLVVRGVAFMGGVEVRNRPEREAL